MSKRTPTVIPVPGERLGRLTAIEPGPDYVRGNSREPRWVFACECGHVVTWKVSSVRSSLSRGWISCPDCYRAHKAAEGDR